MSGKVLITNDTFYDKDYNRTFSYQEKYKFFSVNSGTSTLVPIYKEYLSQVIGERINDNFKDQALDANETIAIQGLFKTLLEEKLEK